MDTLDTHGSIHAEHAATIGPQIVPTPQSTNTLIRAQLPVVTDAQGGCCSYRTSTKVLKLHLNVIVVLLIGQANK